MSRTPLEEFYLIEVVTGIFPTSEVVVRIHAGGGRPRDILVSLPMLDIFFVIYSRKINT